METQRRDYTKKGVKTIATVAIAVFSAAPLMVEAIHPKPPARPVAELVEVDFNLPGRGRDLPTLSQSSSHIAQTGPVSFVFIVPDGRHRQMGKSIFRFLSLETTMEPLQMLAVDYHRLRMPPRLAIVR